MTEQILAVQIMQDYIGSHYAQDISLADLSKVCNYSPWYAHRLFREYVGIAPGDYIRRLRLSRSALRLKRERAKIIDVAFDLGFGSVDGYTRAFFREFGMTPMEYARNPIPITLFIPYRVESREAKKEKINMDSVKSVFVQLIHKPQRKVVIKRGIAAEEYFAYCGEVGCDIWGMLMSMDSLCGEPVCLWLPEAYKKPNTSTYVQGVEVGMDRQEVIPAGFDVITLPAAEYLMFQGEPFREEDYCEAIQAVQHAMNRYNPAAIGYVWDPTNPRIQLEPRGDRGYIELLPVKKA